MAEKKAPSPDKIRKAAPAHLKLLERYLMSDETLNVKGWPEAMEKAGFIPLSFRGKKYAVHKKMFQIKKDDRRLYTEGRIPVPANGGVRPEPLVLQTFPYLFMLKKINAYNKTVKNLRKYNLWGSVINRFEDYLRRRGSKKATTALYNDSLPVGYHMAA